jgi:predicted phosphodiesterase
MSDPVIRVFSDLHYQDSESALHNLAALAPLLAGADQIVLNGDTLDSQAAHGLPHVGETRAFFARHAPRVTFLSGNHDPDISPHGELSLHDDRVWITHGDVLFPDIAPWSSLREEIRRRLASLHAEIPAEELARLETRLRLNRVACHHLPELHDRFDRRLLTRVGRLVHNIFPPDRLLAMLRVWRTTPAIARRLALAQRPRARLVLLGHTHFPGVWRDRAGRGPVVVNTGSFCRPFGGQFVELRGDAVQVVRIERHNGEFHRGRVVAGFSLAP